MKKKKKAAKKKRPNGRPPSAMKPANQEKILAHVRLGLWPDRAALLADVNPSTMRQYRSDNPKFRTALEKAEVQAESNFHGRILRAASGTPPVRDEDGKVVDPGRAPIWTANAWMLERRFGERYSRNPSVGVLVPGEGAQVAVITTGPPVDDWQEHFEKMATIARGLKPTRNGNSET